MVSGDEKSLASKLIWKGKSWPKVAVSSKAVMFLWFWGKSSLVSWVLLRFTWSDHCRSGIIYKMFLRCIDWLSKFFKVTWTDDVTSRKKRPAHSWVHTGTMGISGLMLVKIRIFRAPFLISQPTRDFFRDPSPAVSAGCGCLSFWSKHCCAASTKYWIHHRKPRHQKSPASPLTSRKTPDELPDCKVRFNSRVLLFFGYYHGH